MVGYGVQRDTYGQLEIKREREMQGHGDRQFDILTFPAKCLVRAEDQFVVLHYEINFVLNLNDYI